MLELKEVTKVYREKNGVETRALDGVSVRFPARGMIFVVGKSGCGKSTLLNILGGLDRPDAGEMLVRGKSLASFSDKELDGYRNGYVGFVFQEYNLLDEFTVRENVSLACELQGAKNSGAEIDAALKKVGMEGFASRRANALSGGQKQRVAIARALVKAPRVLLADEPTGALDSESGEQVMALLKELSAEKLVVVVSHDADFAERYADGIIEMKDGKILSERGVRAEEGEAPSERPLSPAHLPARYAFRIGMRSLRAKPVRLAFTVLLSLVAFLCFGLFSTMALYSEKNAAISSLAACSDHGYIAGSKVYERELVQYKDGKEVSSSSEQVQTGYTLAEFLDISEHFPGAIAMAKAELSFTPPLSLEGSVGQFYSKTLSGFVLADESLDWLAGRAPVGENEIALTDFVFSCMQYGEFRENSLQEPPVLAQYEDVIGKEITFAVNGSTYRQTFVVTGVFRGETLPARYEAVRADALAGKLGSGTEESFRWQRVRDDGLYAVAAVSEAGLAYGSALLHYAEASGKDYADHFLKNDDVFKYTVLLDVDGGTEVGFGERTLLSDLRDRTGAGMLDVFDVRGERVQSLPAQSVAVGGYEFALLIDPLFREYFERGGDAVSSGDFTALVLALLNGTADAETLCGVLVRIGQMMEQCGIEMPSVLIRTGGESYSANVAGVIFGARRVYGMYVSDELLPQLYRGEQDLSVTYSYRSEYTPAADAPVTRVLLPFDGSEESARAIVGMVWAKGEEGTGFAAENLLFEEVHSFSEAISVFSDIFLGCGIGFGVFSVLLLFNFLSASIAAKRREIGVLRALGARVFDVFRIFLVEALFVALSCGVLCLIGTAVLCEVFNGALADLLALSQIEMLAFGIAPALLILVLAFGSALLSTWASVALYARRTPAQGIRGVPTL